MAIILIQTIPSISWAEAKNKYEKIYSDCIDKIGTINNGVVEACSNIASKAAKKEMNRLYNIIYKNISKQSTEDAKKFENSQKAWLKYRNNHCKLMGSYVGSPMYNYCPMQLNILRVLELQEMSGE